MALSTRLRAPLVAVGRARATLAGGRTEKRDADRGPCFGATGKLQMPRRAAGCSRNDISGYFLLYIVLYEATIIVVDSENISACRCDQVKKTRDKSQKSLFKAVVHLDVSRTLGGKRPL